MGDYKKLKYENTKRLKKKLFTVMPNSNCQYRFKTNFKN